MTRRVNSVSDAPLRAWGEALPRHAIRRRRGRLLLTWALLGSGMCLAPIVLWPAPRLLWNGSASAPIGLYRVVPGTSVGRGDFVVAWPPASARELAVRRGYLPAGVPLVKRVAAGPGDQICALGRRLILDGEPIVVRSRTDAAARAMPWWTGCIRLNARQVLLLMPRVAASFDGRYFGPTDTHDIVGKAYPLWLR